MIDGQTDRQTVLLSLSVTIGCIYIVARCGLKISCTILWRQMILTGGTISVKFIISIYIMNHKKRGSLFLTITLANLKIG